MIKIRSRISTNQKSIRIIKVCNPSRERRAPYLQNSMKVNQVKEGILGLGLLGAGLLRLRLQKNFSIYLRLTLKSLIFYKRLKVHYIKSDQELIFPHFMKPQVLLEGEDKELALPKAHFKQALNKEKDQKAKTEMKIANLSLKNSVLKVTMGS
jgi:hypothetical protein